MKWVSDEYVPNWMSEKDYIIYYGGEEALTEYDVSNNGPINWMNYYMVGNVCGSKVYPNNSNFYLDSFLVQCSKDNIIGPFRQKKDKTYWAQVVLHKFESNLDIWMIHIFGCDDAAFSKHYTSKELMTKDLEFIKQYGIEDLKSLNFFWDC